MNVKPLNSPEIKSQLLDKALVHTTSAVAILQPACNCKTASKDFVVLYSNPSFRELNGDINLDDFEQFDSDQFPVLKLNKVCAAIKRVQLERIHQKQIVNYQKDERSLVLELDVVMDDGHLIVTIDDITSLSHNSEMLTLQTTLLEENNRSLEFARKAHENEITRHKITAEKLRRMATTDSLSGLANRRSFLEKAASEFRRNQRYNHSLSMVMLDLDKFKNVNDCYGHAGGDAVIVAVGQICHGLSRNGVDCVGRLGGEEFAVLLPETDLDSARLFAERLRQAIEKTSIINEGEKIAIPASMGVSSLKVDDRDISSLIKRADAALYHSKEAGRNRISLG